MRFKWQSSPRWRKSSLNEKQRSVGTPWFPRDGFWRERNVDWNRAKNTIHIRNCNKYINQCTNKHSLRKTHAHITIQIWMDILSLIFIKQSQPQSTILWSCNTWAWNNKWKLKMNTNTSDGNIAVPRTWTVHTRDFVVPDSPMPWENQMRAWILASFNSKMDAGDRMCSYLKMIIHHCRNIWPAYRAFTRTNARNAKWWTQQFVAYPKALATQWYMYGCD